MDPNRSKDASFWKLVEKFKDVYNSPAFVYSEDKASYEEAFLRFMTGAYGIFRNPGSHTFIEHYKNDRYNIQFLILGDIMLSLIDAWIPKDPKV